MSLHIAIDNIESEPGVRVVVRLEGLLNTPGAETAQHFLQILLEQQRPPPHIVLEGSKLTYLNSSGLRALAQISRDLRKHGRRLALCTTNEQLRILVEVAGLSTVVLMYDSLEDAHKALLS